MTLSEFVGWGEFFKAYPFDDFHRYHRPAGMVAAAFAGQLEARLRWLQPDAANDGMTDADMTTCQAFGYTRKGD